MKQLLACLVFLFLPGLTHPGWTATYYVATNGDDSAAGTEWGTAVANIMTGVVKAVQSGDMVLVSNGTYVLSGPGLVCGSVTNVVWITNAISMRGFSGNPADTVVDGETIYRGLWISNNQAVVDSIAVTRGYGGPGAAADNYGGGGVFVAAGLLTNCILSNNAANLGGGVCVWPQPASAIGRLDTCQIYSNTATTNGGGVYLKGNISTNLWVLNCLVSNNLAVTNGNGGGIYGAENCVVSNCVVVNNTATNTISGSYGYGGGLYLTAGLIRDCTNISANSARRGGGAYAKQVWGCMISNNRAYRLAGSSVGGAGGGLYCSASDSVITGCTLIANGADGAGGGVLTYGMITDCIVSNNQGMVNPYYSQGGGGIFVCDGGVVHNCLIVTNQAVSGVGGGVAVNSGYVRIEYCTIQNNQSVSSGGGLYYPSGTGIVENCLFDGNCKTGDAGLGNYGGGAYFGAGVRVRNCLFMRNVAVGRCGGVGLDSVGSNSGYFANCTVVSNKAAAGYGGGMWLKGTNNLVLNCVIYSNAAGGSSNDWYIESTLDTLGSACTPIVLPGTNNITTYPQFLNPAGGNWRLKADSPCINAGTNQDWVATAMDLQGRPRLYYGRVDIGCYEYWLNVKVNGIPIDRIKSINGAPKNRIFRISE